MIDKILLKNAVIQYTYWGDDSNSPLGILWVTFCKGQNGKTIALLLNMMTAFFYRRKGICKELLNELIKDCDIIISPVGSDEGGKEALLNFGFLLNNNLDMFIYQKAGG